MIGNEKCIGVCEYALKEMRCTLPHYCRTEGVSHFHENPGSGDQRLAQVLSCSHSAFACASLRPWWQTDGQAVYADADALRLLCDGGGSKRARTYLYKAALDQRVQESGVERRVAHSPPYTSKYNPIEQRLFPHLTRACQGVICISIDLVKDVMAKTTTKTGLEVNVSMLAKVYATGRKVAATFKEQMRVIFDDALPQWNNRVLPCLTSMGEVIEFLIVNSKLYLRSQCDRSEYQLGGVTSKSCVPKAGSTTERPVSCMVSRLCS